MDKVQRNKRERIRVKALNGCFVELMRRLPNSNHITMTKAQILKSATDYIDFLETRIRVMQHSLRNRDDERTERSFSRPSCRFSKGSREHSYLKPRPVADPSRPFCYNNEGRHAFQEIDRAYDLPASGSFVLSSPPVYPVPTQYNCCSMVTYR